MKENIEDIFDEFSMPYEIIPKLAEICKKYQIEFMSTPFSVEDAKQVDPFVSAHKIASFEINHVRLLEFIAKTKKGEIKAHIGFKESATLIVEGLRDKLDSFEE